MPTKLGSGSSTPVLLKPKVGTLCGANGRILKLVVLIAGSDDFLQVFFKTFGEVERTEAAGKPLVLPRA